jgi:hypothetical protein
MIQGAHHGEPGDATTDNEYAARSAALMLYALTLACGKDAENALTWHGAEHFR